MNCALEGYIRYLSWKNCGLEGRPMASQRATSSLDIAETREVRAGVHAVGLGDQPVTVGKQPESLGGFSTLCPA